MSKLPNAGWLFYRGYYDTEDLSDKRLEAFVQSGKLTLPTDSKEKQFFVQESQALLDFKWSKSFNHHFMVGAQGFELTTQHPGLLIGTGYGHQTGSIGEFKSGFFFDHTTGLPVLPGSSVKGVLRSVFPNRDASPNHVLQSMKTSFVKKLLVAIDPGLESVDVAELESEIFDGKNKQGKYMPMQQHNRFHDAYIVKINEKVDDALLFEDDYITPHGKNLLKNPTPVRFLKIRGGVAFRFNFDLHASVISGITVTIEHKELLFKTILLRIGVGAKTNVGYGQFI